MKKLLPIIIAIIIVVSGAFYGGMKYAESYCPAKAFSDNVLRNFSPEDRQQFSRENIGGNLQRGVIGSGAGFLNGEVVDKDEQSLTLKMMDGSSKIIFFSDSTQISKTTDGSIGDIEIGKQITISGQQNFDGSYTAKTIQLSPRIVQPEI